MNYANLSNVLEHVSKILIAKDKAPHILAIKKEVGISKLEVEPSAALEAILKYVDFDPVKPEPVAVKVQPTPSWPLASIHTMSIHELAQCMVREGYKGQGTNDLDKSESWILYAADNPAIDQKAAKHEPTANYWEMVRDKFWHWMREKQRSAT